MNKFTSIITSLLLILALTVVPGAGNVSAQTADIQTEEEFDPCDPNERGFFISGIDAEENAPATITVHWGQTISEVIGLTAFFEGIGFYITSLHLDIIPTMMSFRLYEGWTGEAAMLYGPEFCDGAPTATPMPTAVPTATPTPTEVPTAMPTQGVTPTVTVEVSPTSEVTPTSGVTPTNGVTPTEVVLPTDAPTATPTVSQEPTVTTSPAPTEEPRAGNEEENPTVAPEPTADVTATPTEKPVGGSGGGDGLSDGRSDGRSSSPSSTSNGQIKAVLGSATTMAKTGGFGQLLMNLSGVMGMLSTMAGLAIYVKQRKNN